MAINVVNNQVVRSGFCVNFNSSDLSGCEEVVAAVAGKSIHVERALISFSSAVNVTIGSDESSSAVGTVVFGPLYGAANASIEINVSERPVKLTTATPLTIDASGAVPVTGIISGYIE